MNRALLAVICVLVGCSVAAGAADPCPDGVQHVYCFVSPCQSAKCTNYPSATCQDDYCGGCNARFYDENNLEVTSNC